MKHIRGNIKKERGSIMVVCLMILMLLTLIGIQATRNTTVELKIAENEAAHRQALYCADSGVSFAMRLQEFEVGSLAKGDPIPQVPSGSPFQLYLEKRAGSDPMVIEIRSEARPDLHEIRSDLRGVKGSSKITAGIQLPTPYSGPPLDRGQETSY